MTFVRVHCAGKYLFWYNLDKIYFSNHFVKEKILIRHVCNFKMFVLRVSRVVRKVDFDNQSFSDSVCDVHCTVARFSFRFLLIYNAFEESSNDERITELRERRCRFVLLQIIL